MDFVRDILLKVESGHKLSSADLLASSATEAEEEKLEEHLKMLTKEARLIDGISSEMMSGTQWLHLRLTWSGHEFVDTVRDPEIWLKTKQGAKLAGGFSLDIVKALAKGYIKKQLAEKTGVEIDL